MLRRRDIRKKDIILRLRTAFLENRLFHADHRRVAAITVELRFRFCLELHHAVLAGIERVIARRGPCPCPEDISFHAGG